MAEARTIRAFLRRNGESTAVKIAGGTGLEKPVVNKHLYSLHESGQLLKTDATPPVWSLKELKNRDRDLDLDPDLPEMMEKLEVSSSSEEDQIRQQLRSGPVKAHQIASGTKKPKQSVNKALYEMMRKGEVEKCEESNAWTLRTHQPRRRRANDGDGSQSSHFGYKEHFEEIRELGEGAFGCVKLVRHKIDGTLYALKRVELTSKADSEVKALARLNHPNVVRYVTCWTSRVGDGESSQSDRTSSFSSEPWDESSGKDSGKSDAASSSSQESPDAVDGWHLFIQMEFCGGGTLSDWITERNDKKKPRIQSETLRIFSDIVGGMQFVHSQNFIHRDLKPDNVLFDDIRTVKIGDFGLVAPLCDNNGLPVHRSKRRGTPTYTSPEQANMRKYDEKTDVFPLGLIWFEMLWQISSRMERAKLWENLRKAEFPAGFEEEHAAEASLVKKMLSHNPEERPAAGEIRHTLQLFTARLDPLSSRTV